MSRLFKDPLLSVTRKLLRLSYFVAFGLAVLLLLLALLGLIVGGHPGPNGHRTAQDSRDLILFFLWGAPVVAIYGWFLLTLRRIVDTVAAGAAFTTANAGRLATMGWLAVALKLVVLATVALFAQSKDQLIHLASRFNGPGLLMILVLFILARVFREGAAMREDLEGTV